MKPETLAALQKSIKRWEFNRDNPEQAALGPEYCALCDRFAYPATRFIACELPDETCPVAEKARVRGCHETPYYRVRQAFVRYKDAEDNHTDDEIVAKSEFQWHAQLEVDFLKSLLPKEEECGKSAPNTSGPSEQQPNVAS